jgi:hypothetical protein
MGAVNNYIKSEDRRCGYSGISQWMEDCYKYPYNNDSFNICDFESIIPISSEYKSFIKKYGKSIKIKNNNIMRKINIFNFFKKFKELIHQVDALRDIVAEHGKSINYIRHDLSDCVRDKKLEYIINTVLSKKPLASIGIYRNFTVISVSFYDLELETYAYKIIKSGLTNIETIYDTQMAELIKQETYQIPII